MTAPLINSGIIYLETFLDSVHLLPTDLQRALNYIRVLDERIQELRTTAEEKLALFVSAWQNKPRPLPQEAQDQRIEIDEMHTEIIHCQEEKVIYAQKVEELLRSKVDELDEHRRVLESEIAMHAPMDVGLTPGVSLLREEARSGMDSLPMQSYASDMTARMAPNPSVNVPMPSRKSLKGATQRKSPAGTPAQSQTGYMPSMGVVPSRGNQMGGAVPQMMMGHMVPGAQQMHGQMAVPYGYAADPNMQPMQQLEFFAPVIPGMASHSKRVQAVGRLLTAEDISPALIGQQAELYWPDDGFWYLIKITNVNMAQRSADVQYFTGEIERDVNLDEIARKSEMSIILPQR